VRDALAHLHDLPYLQNHPLARPVGGRSAAPGRALRGRLIEAIDTLRAREGGAADDRAGRIQRLLELRYVEGLTSDEVSARLGVSQSEYYRAHQRGVAAVASALGADDLPGPSELALPAAVPVGRDHPDAAGGALFRGAVPRPLTSFVGRRHELGEAMSLLPATRLLTFTGSGGCGKTRLAVAVARALASRFVDGACFVDLAPVMDEGLVPLAVLSALGLPEQPARTPREVLVEHLRARDLLLVLDNCEHLVDGCARLAEALLQECAGLRVLATSRQLLGVPGETAWRVPSLSAPDPREVQGAEQIGQYEAVRLFVERAQLVQPSFRLTDQNAAAVAEVCARLDGIPLALELAAARLRVLPVQQIASRLDQRFRILTGGARAAPRRQQTLRALVDWSHDLLSEPERVLFRRLAVFVAGCTLEAAEDVTGYDPIAPSEVLDLLTGLVDKSLVGAEAHDGRERYRLLETIRQYAEEELLQSGDAETTRNRPRDWWLEQSLTIGLDRVQMGRQDSAGRERLARLTPMLDNLRAALAWCAASPAGAHLGLELAHRAVWLWPGFSEQRRWIETFLRLAPERTATRGSAILYLNHLLRWQRAFEPAVAFAEEAVAIFAELGDPLRENRARSDLALARANLGEHARAIEDMAACLAAARRNGDEPGVIACLRDLGCLGIVDRQFARARSWLEESLRLARATDFRLATSAGLLRLAILDRLDGDLRRARAHAEEALRVRERGEPWLPVAWELMRAELANLARAEGRLDEARAGLVDVLRAAVGRGFDVARGELLCMIAIVEIERGALAWGVSLVAAGDWGPGPIGTIHVPDVRVETPEYLARARAALGEAEYAAAWSRGQAMTLEAALALVLADAAPDLSTGDRARPPGPRTAAGGAG
jgi:predicted ATPase